MFPSKIYYTLREAFDLLGSRLYGDGWTGGEATAKYPELGDDTIRTLSSYLANPESGSNAIDFPADKASPNVSEPATKTGLPDIPVRSQSLNTLLRYAKLADEQGKGVIEVIRDHSSGGQQHVVHSRELPAFGGASFEPAPLDANFEYLSLFHGALREVAMLIKFDRHPLSQEQHELIAVFGNYIKEQTKLAEVHNRQTEVETEIIQAAGAGEILLEVFDAEVGSLTPIPAQTCLAEGFYLNVARNAARSPSRCWPDDGVVAIRRTDFDDILAALDSDAKAAGDRKDPSSSRAGRKPRYDETDFMVELVRVVHDEGLPQAQAELETKMLQWCQANWPEEPSVAWIRPRVSKVYKAIQGSRS